LGGTSQSGGGDFEKLATQFANNAVDAAKKNATEFAINSVESAKKEATQFANNEVSKLANAAQNKTEAAASELSSGLTNLAEDFATNTVDNAKDKATELATVESANNAVSELDNEVFERKIMKKDEPKDPQYVQTHFPSEYENEKITAELENAVRTEIGKILDSHKKQIQTAFISVLKYALHHHMTQYENAQFKDKLRCEYVNIISAGCAKITDTDAERVLYNFLFPASSQLNQDFMGNLLATVFNAPPQPTDLHVLSKNLSIGEDNRFQPLWEKYPLNQHITELNPSQINTETPVAPTFDSAEFTSATESVKTNFGSINDQSKWYGFKKFIFPETALLSFVGEALEPISMQVLESPDVVKSAFDILNGTIARMVKTIVDNLQKNNLEQMIQWYILTMHKHTSSIVKESIKESTTLVQYRNAGLTMEDLATYTMFLIYCRICNEREVSGDTPEKIFSEMVGKFDTKFSAGLTMKSIEDKIIKSTPDGGGVFSEFLQITGLLTSTVENKLPSTATAASPPPPTPPPNQMGGRRRQKTIRRRKLSIRRRTSN